MLIRSLFTTFICIMLITGCSTDSSFKPSSLRSTYIQISKSEAIKVLKKKNFFDYRKNRSGGFTSALQVITRNNEPVIIDTSFKLMWHSGGSEQMLSYKKATKWIEALNSNKFAGYNNWRFPTIEEAATLLRKSKNEKRLFTYNIFSPVQIYIWTGDKYSEHIQWVISFTFGSISTDSVNGKEYVRPVRNTN